MSRQGQSVVCVPRNFVQVPLRLAAGAAGNSLSLKQSGTLILRRA